MEKNGSGNPALTERPIEPIISAFCDFGDSDEPSCPPLQTSSPMQEPLILAPKLDLAAASELMSTIRGCRDTEITLDMTEVEHLGVLCVQVILSAAKTAASENKKISITNPSDRVIDQLRVMGMTPEALTRGCQ